MVPPSRLGRRRRPSSEAMARRLRMVARRRAPAPPPTSPTGSPSRSESAAEERSMAVEIRVPPLGESLVDAVVGQWLKGEGDDVSRGETIVELETDKVNLDVTAPEDGVLGKIERGEGDVVTV